MELELSATVVVGLGASLVMDLWAVMLKRAFGMAAPNYCLLGRWLSHIPGGVFKHTSIAAAGSKPAECIIGWIAHFLIGILFALGFVAWVGPDWLQSPTLVPALIFGIVTVGFPFLIMHPAFGLGIAASKAPNPTQARLRSLMNHAVFGFGLYVSALLVSAII